MSNSILLAKSYVTAGRITCIIYCLQNTLHKHIWVLLEETNIINGVNKIYKHNKAQMKMGNETRFRKNTVGSRLVNFFTNILLFLIWKIATAFALPNFCHDINFRKSIIISTKNTVFIQIINILVYLIEKNLLLI